ncbi:MAG TPA: glucose-1-phosphate adenylyltransferase [Candidatus Aminicenantes bacterium]|nr:glucose-1-phosphate adenylyltransferase [Candidatus Aminicenantes bacterium]HDT14338.1 glucose-1-phosphate adenylyltransferase [Candidatus Aminicenantes bacterium]
MDVLSKRTLVMILCGGKGERLYPLTRDRAKPSVPFLGTYRIIDFSLSNALNSGLRRIALLTQYKSLSLDRHILNGWNIFHPESGDYVLSLPAQGRVSDGWYEGTADAVFQNIYTIQAENPEAVLILSGDHVYNADYRKLLLFFARSEADAVIMTRMIPIGEATRFGVIGVDEDRRIVEFQEKPKKPFATPWDPGRSLISMGVYLFKTPVLIKALLKDARNAKSSHDFGRNVLPALIGAHRVFAYTFDDYWEDIGTIDAYWKANMAFLSPSPPVILKDPAWPVRTYKPQRPPTYISGGDLRASIIGPGCALEDCRVVHSIVAEGVRVDPGAEIADSIVLGDVHVRRGARLRKVIVDKAAVIPEGFEAGFDAEKDTHNFTISRAGVRVVPKGWILE